MKDWSKDLDRSLERTLQMVELKDPLGKRRKRDYFYDLKELAWSIEFVSGDDPYWRAADKLAYLITAAYLRGRGVKQPLKRTARRYFYQAEIFLQLQKLHRLHGCFPNLEKTIRLMAIKAQFKRPKGKANTNRR